MSTDEPTTQGPILDFFKDKLDLIHLLRDLWALGDIPDDADGWYVYLNRVVGEGGMFERIAALTDWTELDDQAAAACVVLIENRKLFDGVYSIIEMFIGGESDLTADINATACVMSKEPNCGVSPTIIVLAIQLILALVKLLRG